MHKYFTAKREHRRETVSRDTGSKALVSLPALSHQDEVEAPGHVVGSSVHFIHKRNHQEKAEQCSSRHPAGTWGTRRPSGTGVLCLDGVQVTQVCTQVKTLSYPGKTCSLRHVLYLVPQNTLSNISYLISVTPKSHERVLNHKAGCKSRRARGQLLKKARPQRPDRHPIPEPRRAGAGKHGCREAHVPRGRG